MTKIENIKDCEKIVMSWDDKCTDETVLKIIDTVSCLSLTERKLNDVMKKRVQTAWNNMLVDWYIHTEGEDGFEVSAKAKKSINDNIFDIAAFIRSKGFDIISDEKAQNIAHLRDYDMDMSDVVFTMKEDNSIQEIVSKMEKLLKAVEYDFEMNKIPELDDTLQKIKNKLIKTNKTLSNQFLDTFKPAMLLINIDLDEERIFNDCTMEDMQERIIQLEEEVARLSNLFEKYIKRQH